MEVALRLMTEEMVGNNKCCRNFIQLICTAHCVIVVYSNKMGK